MLSVEGIHSCLEFFPSPFEYMVITTTGDSFQWAWYFKQVLDSYLRLKQSPLSCLDAEQWRSHQVLRCWWEWHSQGGSFRECGVLIRRLALEDEEISKKASISANFPSIMLNGTSNLCGSHSDCGFIFSLCGLPRGARCFHKRSGVANLATNARHCVLWRLWSWWCRRRGERCQV